MSDKLFSYDGYDIVFAVDLFELNDTTEITVEQENINNHELYTLSSYQASIELAKQMMMTKKFNYVCITQLLLEDDEVCDDLVVWEAWTKAKEELS